jgi:hypothetical protein
MLMPRRRGWSGVRRGARLAGRGARRGAKLAERDERRDVQCGGAQRHSKSGCSAEKNQGKAKGATGRWPLRPFLKARTNGGLTTYDIAAFVTLALLLALVLVLLFR